jgi:hypothetical protein
MCVTRNLLELYETAVRGTYGHAAAIECTDAHVAVRFDR